FDQGSTDFTARKVFVRPWRSVGLYRKRAIQSGGQSAFVAGPPEAGLPAHIAERFAPVTVCECVEIFGEPGEFEPQFPRD
ncbi:MAG: hypothetical protein JO232_05720, partial [Verrucomicrobia bacterium]|nr:hypothetical protein [Verrucomicrobiota bacterium]